MREYRLVVRAHGITQHQLEIQSSASRFQASRQVYSPRGEPIGIVEESAYGPLTAIAQSAGKPYFLRDLIMAEPP